MNRLSFAREHVLGLFRIVVGFFFACHGIKDLFGVFGAKAPVITGLWPGWWAAVIELVAGALVCLGAGTRVAAIIGSGSMAYAFFTVHLHHGLLPIMNGGESAAMFSWSLLLIVFTGPGRFALGSALRSHREPATPALSALDATSVE